MNEELKSRLIENFDSILAWSQSTLKSINDLAVEQAPIVIQELYRWVFAESLIYLSIFTVLTLVVWFKGRTTIQSLFKKYADVDGNVSLESISAYGAYGDPELAWVCLHVLRGALSLLFLSITINYFQTLIKMWVAPRLFLLDYITSLLK